MTLMETQAPNTGQLPMLYNALDALNFGQHGKMKLKKCYALPQLGHTHAMPVTVEEYASDQRRFSIIFSAGDSPFPLALLWLIEGVNTYFDADGRPITKDVYIPAYLRGYPFLLAK